MDSNNMVDWETLCMNAIDLGISASTTGCLLVPDDDICYHCPHLECKWCEANAAIALFNTIAQR
jgi:hypothetical protein